MKEPIEYIDCPSCGDYYPKTVYQLIEGKFYCPSCPEYIHPKEGNNGSDNNN